MASNTAPPPPPASLPFVPQALRLTAVDGRGHTAGAQRRHPHGRSCDLESQALRDGDDCALRAIQAAMARRQQPATDAVLST